MTSAKKGEEVKKYKQGSPLTVWSLIDSMKDFLGRDLIERK